MIWDIGTFGDKAATLERFKENYTKLLSDSIKRRLVLENDEVNLHPFVFISSLSNLYNIFY